MSTRSRESANSHNLWPPRSLDSLDRNRQDRGGLLFGGEMKHCRRCGQDKPDTAFWMTARGLFSWCKECGRKQSRDSSKDIKKLGLPTEPRKCLGCGSTKQAGEFGTRKRQFAPYCKECMRALGRYGLIPLRIKRRRRGHHEDVWRPTVPIPTITARPCVRCNELLPISGFYEHVLKRGGGLCKKCLQDDGKRYRESAKGKVTKRAWENSPQGEAYRRRQRIRWKDRYRNDPEFREKILARDRERYHREDKARNNAKMREWKKTPKGRKSTTIQQQKRRARKAAVVHDLTAEQWESTLEYFGYQCAYCGQKEDLEQDHFVPLCMGGGYTVGNIIPACPSCNSSKGGGDPNVWCQRHVAPKRLKRIVAWTDDLMEF